MTALPLFESDLLYRPTAKSLVNIRTTPLTPPRAPMPGEQYRFHFDMTKCIGCKCCVVACNEQNGNPAGINWRRVGEIEGGYYPNTQRHYLSIDRKSTRLNSSHGYSSYAVFCLKKKRRLPILRLSI